MRRRKKNGQTGREKIETKKKMLKGALKNISGEP